MVREKEDIYLAYLTFEIVSKVKYLGIYPRNMKIIKEKGTYFFLNFLKIAGR